MGLPGVIMIKVADFIRPHLSIKQIGVTIIEDAAKHEMLQQTRFTCRFFPVDVLCKARKFEDFSSMAGPALKEMFPESESDKKLAWCLEFKKRNNDKVNKNDYQQYLYEQLTVKGHVVSYDHADVECLVEVFRDMLVFAALPKYKLMKKYNLQTLAMTGE